MKAVSKLGLFAYVLAAVTVALDQASKFWILHVFQLPLKVTVPVAGPFHLTMVWNRGVSFGLLRADVDLTRWALVAFSIIVSVFLAVWVRKAGRALTAVALRRRQEASHAFNPCDCSAGPSRNCRCSRESFRRRAPRR